MPLEIVRNDITNMQELLNSVKRYIDERYIEEKTKDEYSSDSRIAAGAATERERAFKALRRREDVSELISFGNSEEDLSESSTSEEYEMQDSEPVFRWKLSKRSVPTCASIEEPEQVCASIKLDDSLEFLLKNLDAGFSDTLLRIIDLSGKKDSDVYKKANVDRKLFSKIRNNPEYKPSKPTALAFAFALELDLYETKEFIARAGYALSRSSKFDIIVEYFLLHRNYDIFELNNVLYEFDQPLIGA